MKDEIKEINFSEMLFNRDERLLDYITNSQKENKEQEELISRLYSIIDDDEENFKLLDKENERLKIEKKSLLNTHYGLNVSEKIYKQRNEKAIEYNKKNIKSETLNKILQGEDKK